MKETTPVSLKQVKVLGSAIRIQILHLLKGNPKSAKQVADLLGRSPGSIHYHVQRLFDSGLIKLASTSQINGITEKFYTAEATMFEPPEYLGETSVGRLITHVLFNPEELDEFKKDVRELVSRWEERQSTARNEGRKEISIRMQLYEVTDQLDE